jgi:ABC-type polysaccharide transport system, permease component
VVVIKAGNSKGSFIKRFKSQKELQIMAIPLVIWCILIFYVPLLGNVIAFQDYRVTKGILHSRWVGFKNFIDFFTSMDFGPLMKNTFGICMLQLLASTVLSLLFSLFLNEIRIEWYKRTVQTVSYLPYFISWAICANFFIVLLSDKGILNNILVSLGMINQPMAFLQEPRLYWTIVTIQYIWKTTGWNAIIYLAAITGIPTELYEASVIDGAGRFKRMWHITLPGMSASISVLLIMNSGTMLQGAFEQLLLMFNPAIMDVGEILATYIYKRGLGGGEFSFATAAGIFQTVVALAMLFIVNKAVKKITGTGVV